MMGKSGNCRENLGFCSPGVLPSLVFASHGEAVGGQVFWQEDSRKQGILNALCLDPDARGLLWSPSGGNGLAPDVESSFPSATGRAFLQPGCAEGPWAARARCPELDMPREQEDAVAGMLRRTPGRRGAGGARGPAGSELPQTCWGLLWDEKLIKVVG